MFRLDDETRRRIVRPHIHDTRCYLVSSHPPCTEVARQQQAVNRLRKTPIPSGRDIVIMDYAQIADVDVPKSWLIIALLCDGDDITPLAAWVKKGVRARADRIRFYHHQSMNPEPALAPWIAVGLRPPKIDAFSDQRGLSARFGQDILLRIIDDWGPGHAGPTV